MNAAVQRIRAEGDPTEALAAEFDDADERLSELEEARAEVEGEVADLTKELQDKQRELETALEAERRQQDKVSKAYSDWYDAYSALPDDAAFTDIYTSSEFAGEQLR